MTTLLSNIRIQVNPKIYIKDPETSALGRKIIQESVNLIDETGFDHFTFKKLGARLGSNESSIYRYFENKHKLLIYLSSWYWTWMEYRIVLATTNVSDPLTKLLNAVKLVTEKIQDDESTDYINESVLNRIIITEFTKTFLTKEVDEENKEGFFLIYKSVIYRLNDMIKEVNPDFPFSKSLASSIVEGAHHQHFLKDHLKTITDCNESISPSDYYQFIISTILKKQI